MLGQSPKERECRRHFGYDDHLNLERCLKTQVTRIFDFFLLEGLGALIDACLVSDPSWQTFRHIIIIISSSSAYYRHVLSGEQMANKAA